MDIYPFQQILDAETLAADVLHLALVLLVQRLHDEMHQHGAFASKFLQIDFLRVVRTVHRAAVMDEVLHLHIEQQRFVGVFHVERIIGPVLRDDAHVRLRAEVPYRRLHADDVLRTVSLARDKVRRAQVHIAHCRGKQDMHRLVIRDLQTVRRYHAVKHKLPGQSVIQVAVLLRLRIDVLYQFQLLRLRGGGAVVFHFLCVSCTDNARHKGKHHHYFSDTHFYVGFSG